MTIEYLLISLYKYKIPFLGEGNQNIKELFGDVDFGSIQMVFRFNCIIKKTCAIWKTSLSISLYPTYSLLFSGL